MHEHPTDHKLYVVVRGDLSPGLACAQAVHAAFAFAGVHPALTTAWQRDSQYLVILSVPDELALTSLMLKAAAADGTYTLWREPDLDDQATALTLGPGSVARRLTANLPLFGRQLV